MEGLFPSIGGLLFSVLLFITYYSKQRFDSVKNKMFRLMLLFCILLNFTDIASYLIFKYINNDFLTIVSYKIDWLVGYIWYSFFYYYSFCFLNGYEDNDFISLIKEKKSAKKFLIIYILSCFIYFFIPITDLNINNITWLPKYISYYVIICASLVAILIIINGLKSTLKRNRKIILIMIIELIGFVVLQFLFPKISFAPMAMILQTYFLYFIIENPDIKISKEVEEVKNDIEKSNKAKTDFLSNMSHEIRSPMNAIVGFSNSLLNISDFDEQSVRSDIKNISDAGSNLLDIINNILDISKIETGKEELYCREYSLVNVINELSKIIDSKLENSKVKLIIDISSDIPNKLYGDQTKLYQILLNILTNSVKYTEIGKIKLSASCENIGDNCLIHFRISDTGFGIKKEDYDKLFEKFARLDSAKYNEIEGTGLGLAITKKYVDLMNGKIWFESEYEVGTTFYVDINQKIIDNNKALTINEKSNEDDNKYKDCSAYKILIVDDNKLNIKVASRILQRYNFNIDTAESGKECINKVKSGEKYDMIFMDHMMPELDGIKTLHIIKRIEDFKCPPVVVLTANAIAGMKDMYLNEGFDEYLSKPINIEELNKVINKYF